MSANNEKLIIFEQLRRNYTNRSVVKAVDTQFKYFSFPPSTTIDADNFNVDLPDLNLSEFGVDPISGFHRVPIDPNSSSNEYKKITLSYQSSWNVSDLNPSGNKGPKLIPFSQTLSGAPLAETQGFVLTPEIIELLRSTNQVVKFTIATSVNQKETSDPLRNTGYEVSITRDMPTNHRQNNKTGADGNPIYGSTKPRSYVTSQNYANYTGFTGSSYSSFWPYIKLVYIIDPADMFDYDIYFVRLVAGGPSWYLRSTMYWNIEVIDDPGKGLTGNAKFAKYGKQPTTYRIDNLSP